MFEVIKTLAVDQSTAEKYLTDDKDYSAANKGQGGDLMSIVNTIINVALGVIGMIAVVMIILGGVQYTTSSGDAAKVKKAKDTILYGIIGLVVALLAFAIVNFVIKGLFEK